MSAVGGSFPSGHMASVGICLGGALLVIRARTRWWEWLPVGAIALSMAFSLLVQSAHWLTDVLGGALLTVGVLGAASTVSMLRRVESTTHDPSPTLG
jgi:membrane-associated phospholipid phosphatase